MRFLFCIMLITFSYSGTVAQTTNTSNEADAIKKAVGIIAAAKKPNVEVVTRDLRELEGQIIGVYEDTFVVDLKRPKKRGITITLNIPSERKIVTIKYRDVLQIEGKGAVLSLVPDPKLKTYSEWLDMRSIGVGAFLQVHTKDGKKTHGAFLTSSDDGIRLMQGNTQTEIARQEIVRIYQLAGDLEVLQAKLFKGGRRGLDVAEAILPITDAAARAHPAGLGLGIAIGVGTAAIMHFLSKRGIKRVLLYAQ